MSGNDEIRNTGQSLVSEHRLTRRQLLAAAARMGLVSSALPGQVWRGLSAASSGCGRLQDIKNVVIFIQENRSFDHYFGSYRGVNGFKDNSPVFRQPDPANASDPPLGYLLPFHLNTQTTNAACTHDITHDWVPQHQSWDGGKMDGFVTSRLPIDSNDAALTMGYYTRSDLPFYFAVADAFTLCDSYFCSVLGPTDRPLHLDHYA
jgi:phospholipase C